MGGATSSPQEQDKPGEWSQRDLHNLRQVYHFLCLHTTTLTACQLDQLQFQSMFSSRPGPGQSRAYWETLFRAIDLKRDGLLDFEEFLEFVAQLKRGDSAARRRLVFQLLDMDGDGYVSRADCQRVTELRRSQAKFELIFHLIDDNDDGVFDFDDFERYCRDFGESLVAQTLKPIDTAFDDVIRPTGIVITSFDVRNTKPHIDWQDHKVEMYSYLCCSPAPPAQFSKAPAY